MAVLFAADQASLVQVVLAVFGAGGVLGAIVALLKLKPEANATAVTSMETAIGEVRAERDYWRTEALSLRDATAAQRARFSVMDQEVAVLEQHVRDLEAELSKARAAGFAPDRRGKPGAQ